MERKGATKHCSWGFCKSDSRYPEKLPAGTFFIRFAKPGRIKDGLTSRKRRENLTKQRRQSGGCMRVEGKILLDLSRLARIALSVLCIFVAELAQQKIALILFLPG